jgi:arsenate reductase
MKGVVSFYGKPECSGNKKQKALLRDAGYMLEERDLLNTSWDQEKLLNFFAGESVHSCVNERAPLITKEGLDPSALSKEDLLEKMIEHPILIKRPLLFFRGQYACGFDSPLVKKLLGEDPGDVGCGCKTE